MPISLFRVDDRLIHGQVVVGWGTPMRLRHIILVDDEVATSDWEQELYRIGVPPQVDVTFVTAASAAAALSGYAADPRPSLLLTGSITTMLALVDGARERISAVNIGGIHHREGRVQRLRYVFLAPDEEAQLRRMAAQGVVITAQDVPSARPVPLDELLGGVPA